MISLFILGPPGAGKTWLARQLLALDGVLTLHPSPKWTIGESVVAAGHYTDAVFSGADTVPYSGAAKALAYWASSYLTTHTLSIFDGSRFSTTPSLEYIAKRSRVIGVHLDVSEETLARQRASRGSNQNQSWMRGATTGARNFTQRVQQHDAFARTLQPHRSYACRFFSWILKPPGSTRRTMTCSKSPPSSCPTTSRPRSRDTGR